jgi:hypothetical protein
MTEATDPSKIYWFWQVRHAVSHLTDSTDHVTSEKVPTTNSGTWCMGPDRSAFYLTGPGAARWLH